MKKAKIFKDEKNKYDPEVGERIAPEGDCTPEHRAIHVENWIIDHDTRLIDDIIKSINKLTPSSYSTPSKMRKAIVDMIREEYMPQYCKKCIKEYMAKQKDYEYKRCKRCFSSRNETTIASMLMGLCKKCHKKRKKKKKTKWII